MDDNDANKTIDKIAQDIVTEDAKKQKENWRPGKATGTGTRQRKRRRIPEIGCLIIVIIILTGGGIYVESHYRPVNPSTPIVKIIATETSTLTAISNAINTSTFTATPPLASLPTDTPTYTPTMTSASAAASTSTPTSTPACAAASTSTPALITSTPVKLRGTITQKTNGHYGAGTPFLGPYGLPSGVTVTLIGRTDDGNWVLVSGRQDAWISVDSISLNQAQVMSLPVVDPDQILPVYKGYPPPEVTSVTNNGNSVTIGFNPVKIRGDQLPGPGVPTTVVEVRSWDPQGHQTYHAYGRNGNVISVPIDSSCGQPQISIRTQSKEGVSAAQQIPLNK